MQHQPPAVPPASLPVPSRPRGAPYWRKLGGSPRVGTGGARPGWGGMTPTLAPPGSSDKEPRRKPWKHACSLKTLKNATRGCKFQRAESNNKDSGLLWPLLPGAPRRQSAFTVRSPVSGASHPGVHSPPHPQSFLS